MKIKHKKAQATAEIAIFGSLLLIGLLALFNYTRNIREQQLLEQQTFREALKTAHDTEFDSDPSDDNDQPDAMGATLTLSKTVDRQAGLLFEPARRTFGSSYSVYWSSAQDAPDLNKYKINEDEKDVPKKILELPRDGGASETPEKELMMDTWEWIGLGLSASSSIMDLLAKWQTWNWWTPWLSKITKGIGFGIYLTRWVIIMDKLDQLERRRARLEDLDERMGDWGYRVATASKDGEDKAGKFYIKEVYAQTWDTITTGSTSYTSTENKTEDAANITNQRRIQLKDSVYRDLRRRYDITQPNENGYPDPSTIEPSQRVYEYLTDASIAQGLGSNLRYSESNQGATVIRGEKWKTRKK